VNNFLERIPFMWPLEDIAELVDGKIVGRSDITVVGAAPINRVQPGQLTFVTNWEYLQKFELGPATVALVPRGLSSEVKTLVQVDNPEAAFTTVMATLVRPPVQRRERQVSSQASISPTACIGDNVAIYPGAVIMDGVTIGSGTTIFSNVTIMENCRIGNDVTLFPGVVCYENTEIGDRVILHANVVVGAYGFGYQQIAGQHRLAPQLGNVCIEADVEIGANSTIDRGTYDSTIIGQGSKLDNLVMIGHNCKIGAHNLLCSQVGIAGSCQTGDYVVMGGQVGLADHLNIGHQVAIGAQSGLMHDVPDKQQVFGSPARPFREQMQILAGLPRMPDTRRALRDLEKQVAKLQSQLDARLSDPTVVDSDAQESVPVAGCDSSAGVSQALPCPVGCDSTESSSDAASQQPTANRQIHNAA